MYPERIDVTLFDNVTPVAITSSTNATPVVVSATSHGLLVGQRVLIYGHGGNLAANGIFQVIAVTTNTFTIGDEVTGANVAGTGVGTATGYCMLAPQVINCIDFKTLDFMIVTSGSAVVTFAAALSLGISISKQTSPRGEYPNFGATASISNPYSFAQLTDLNNGNEITGATGVVVNGTDIDDQYEANINLAKFCTVLPIAWTSGAFTVKATARTSI